MNFDVSKRTIVIAAAVAVVVAVAGGGWYFFGKSRAPVARAPAARTVVAVAVKKEVFSDRLEAIGTLNASESVSITAKTQGIIRTIDFDDGSTVKQGEQIAAIDAGEQDAQLNVELANLEQQKKELARTMGLVKDQHVSQ